MKRSLPVFALIAACVLEFGFVTGQQSPPVPAVKPLIRFPVVAPPAPAPNPKPVPVPAGTALALKPGTVFMFDSDSPVFLKFFPASKANLVKVTQDEGPLGRVKMRFADKPDVTEVRSFPGKFVYTIEPAGVGTVDLVAVPSGLAKADDIQSQCFAVDDGSGSPVDPVPVPPGPTPPTPPVPGLAADVQAAYTAETDVAKAVSAPRLAFLYEDIARTVVDDPKTATVNDLIRAIMTQRKALIGDGLPKVRAAIDKEFQAKLGAATVKMDDAERASAKAVLNQAAQVLKGVK